MLNPRTLFLTMCSLRMIIVFILTIVFLIGSSRKKETDKNLEKNFYSSSIVIVTFVELIIIMEIIHLIYLMLELIYEKLSGLLDFLTSKIRKQIIK